MDAYNELQQKLNTHPAGAPDRPEFLEILRMLFTAEEAELAVHLAFRPKRVDDIAEKTALSADVGTTLCEGLADKGLVFSTTRHGNKAYALQPLVPGIFEMPFMGRRHIDVDFDRLSLRLRFLPVDGVRQQQPEAVR